MIYSCVCPHDCSRPSFVYWHVYLRCRREWCCRARQRLLRAACHATQRCRALSRSCVERVRARCAAPGLPPANLHPPMSAGCHFCPPALHPADPTRPEVQCRAVQLHLEPRLYTRCASYARARRRAMSRDAFISCARCKREFQRRAENTSEQRHIYERQAADGAAVSVRAVMASIFRRDLRSERASADTLSFERSSAFSFFFFFLLPCFLLLIASFLR